MDRDRTACHAAGTSHSRHILIVDDTPEVMEFLSETVRAAGYAIETAANGQEALQCFAESRPAAVLLDLRMPGMSGGETFSALRRIDPEVPLIIMTGLCGDDVPLELVVEGAFDCIQKPVSLEHLKTVIDAATGRARASLPDGDTPQRRDNRKASAERATPRKQLVEARLVGVRVLVVDDAADALELMSFIFQHAGATVITARSAPEAIDIVRRQAIDVLVSDLAMPQRDGFWLVEQLRGEDTGRRLVAIAVSGVTRENRRRVLAAGFDDFLQKPLEPTELCRRVAQLIAA
jgi:CheY-like chemotaxis protein